MCVFSTSADQGQWPSQLLSTSMISMNAPVGSRKGEQAIQRTDIFEDIFDRFESITHSLAMNLSHTV